MATLSGVWFVDGRAPDVPRVPSPLAAAAAAGLVAPDASAVATDRSGRVFIACGGPWVWDRETAAPVTSETGSVLAWDGRLDTGDEVWMRLSGRLDRPATDAALVLAAFERWGLDGLRALAGEWSAVIWDEPRRTLHLARDAMGTRPLYYVSSVSSAASAAVRHGNALWWGTWLGGLVDRSGADAIDEDFIGRYMTLRFSPEVTPYRGVKAVAPATCVSIPASGAVTVTRLWTPRLSRLVCRDPREYEARLRAAWLQAVARRLRTTEPVWAELSGGLDSSSVVCMAHALVASGRMPTRELRILSHATLDAPEGDERRFIAEVERKTGITSEILGVEAHRSTSDDTLEVVSPLGSRGVQLAAARRVLGTGAHLLLSGRGGDAVMGCLVDNSAAVLDEVGEGRWLRALATLRLWSRVTQEPFVALAWHLLRDGGHATGGFDGSGLLVPRLRQAALGDHGEPDLRGVRPGMRTIAAHVLRYSSGAMLDVPHLPPALVPSHPFLDRQLVELVLSLPAAELSAPGATRSLMRRAFAGLVPARVIARQSKGHYPPDALRALRPRARAMRPVDRLQIVRRGWFDAAALDAAIGRLVGGSGKEGFALQLALHLEQWASARERWRAPQCQNERR